jgi:hypothetical protein
VLEHYSDLGRQAQTRRGSPQDPRLPQRPLTASERIELIAFLESLTDDSFVRRYTADADAPRIAGQ